MKVFYLSWSTTVTIGYSLEVFQEKKNYNGLFENLELAPGVMKFGTLVS